MEESASVLRISQGFLKISATPRWKIQRFFRWKMPFAVFRSGSGVSDFEPFALIFPPLSPSGPVYSPTTAPLFTSPFLFPENSDLSTPLV